MTRGGRLEGQERVLMTNFPEIFPIFGVQRSTPSSTETLIIAQDY